MTNIDISYFRLSPSLTWEFEKLCKFYHTSLGTTMAQQLCLYRILTKKRIFMREAIFGIEVTP